VPYMVHTRLLALCAAYYGVATVNSKVFAESYVRYLFEETRRKGKATKVASIFALT